MTHSFCNNDFRLLGFAVGRDRNVIIVALLLVKKHRYLGCGDQSLVPAQPRNEAEPALVVDVQNPSNGVFSLIKEVQ